MISKDEFFRRAETAPAGHNAGSVFRLSVWTYAPDSHLSIESEGYFKVVKSMLVDFVSKKDAEDAMLSFDGSRKDVYRFIISEMPLESIDAGAIRHEWVYDAQGRLIDHSRASMYNPDHGKFYGRPHEKIRFKPGELVEWFDGDETVTLGVVVGFPSTIEHCWERMKCVLEDKRFANVENKEDAYIYDFTDDCYTVIDTPDYMASHEHVAVHYVDVPSIPVSQELRERYEKVYRDYLKSDD